MKYHLIAAFFSNSIWFLTFRELVTRDMSIALFPWYCTGTMFGSVFGVKISMAIERWLGAESDGHLNKPKVDINRLEQRLLGLEILIGQHRDDAVSVTDRVRKLEQRFPERFMMSPERTGNDDSKIFY